MPAIGCSKCEIWAGKRKGQISREKDDGIGKVREQPLQQKKRKGVGNRKKKKKKEQQGLWERKVRFLERVGAWSCGAKPNLRFCIRGRSRKKSFKMDGEEEEVVLK